MASQTYKQYAVLTSSTISFTVCFMIWMMFAVLGIPIKEQLGLNETMNDSLVICKENFGNIWGQKLVNTLRALHDVKYNTSPFEDEEKSEEEDDHEHCHCDDPDCDCGHEHHHHDHE